MVRSIYFDESGYTGKALLDPAQPFFCLASTLIDDAEAGDILKRVFPGYGGQEFKFQSLWRRRERTKAQIIALAKEVYAVRDRVFLWVIDKRFCVLTKFIDFLIEPVLHKLGRDFYKDSYAPKFSNISHSAITSLGEPELYEATIRPFYEFTRDPTEERLRELQRRLMLMSTSTPDGLRFFYETAVIGAVHFHNHSEIEGFEDTFEVHLSSALASVGYWRHRIKDDFGIFHDASSAFFRQADLWDTITSDEVPPQFHPVANGPPLEFPLRIKSTTAVDSKTSPAIQLCDLIAGLAVKAVCGGANAADAATIDAIRGAGFVDMEFNGIRPSDDFPDGAPAALDGPDAVDLLSAVMNPGLKASE